MRLVRFDFFPKKCERRRSKIREIMTNCVSRACKDLLRDRDRQSRPYCPLSFTKNCRTWLRQDLRRLSSPSQALHRLHRYARRLTMSRISTRSRLAQVLSEIWHPLLYQMHIALHPQRNIVDGRRRGHLVEWLSNQTRVRKILYESTTHRSKSSSEEPQSPLATVPTTASAHT